MLTLTGEGISPGLAKGVAFVYLDILKRDSEFCRINGDQISEEQSRIDEAINDVRHGLVTDAKRMESKLGKESATIFLAQEAMLLDRTVVENLKKTLNAEQINAEQVIRTVFKLLASKFRGLDDELLRERGDDIEDLSRRLLQSLAGIHAHTLEKLPESTVLIACRLLPSDTVFLSRLTTVAVVTEFAGRASHATLLARELGIPCVGQVHGLLENVHTGNTVLVYGTEGKAVINPGASELCEYENVLSSIKTQNKRILLSSRDHRAATLDGIHISVMANVRSREDVSLAMDYGADGIGLFRTEPYFMSCKHLPPREEFAQFLLESLAPACGQHIDVRLLDIGADKNPIYVHLPPETEPSLGLRGVRVLLKYPDLLDAQLYALLEVSRHFPIGILVPMVVTENDMAKIMERLRQLAAEMDIHVLPRLGAMIETPAAALSIAILKQYVDFFSIGSNDLTQYAMAAGREDPLVAEYFIDDHPSILRLIKLVVREAGDTPVSLCGELAGRVDVVSSVLATGVRSLSVAAPLVGSVKNAIRKSTT